MAEHGEMRIYWILHFECTIFADNLSGHPGLVGRYILWDGDDVHQEFDRLCADYEDSSHMLYIYIYNLYMIII